MAEKSDEEIIKEVGLETSNDISDQEALDSLSLDNESDILEPIEEDTNTIEQKNDDLNEDVNLTNNDVEQENTKVIENEDKDDMDSVILDKEAEEAIPVQKKQPKIYKILIGIAAFLFLILIAGAILYFTGFFDPEPIKPVEQKKVMKKVEEEIDFNAKELNKKRLNKKLTMLTKHEIMNKEELEAEEAKIKAEEKKKKVAEEKAILEKKKKEEAELAAQFAKIENEKKLLQEHQQAIKEEQERFIELQEQARMELEETKMQLLEELENQKNNQKMPEPIMKEEVVIEDNMEIKDEDQEKENMTFLSFINVATIKGELYKTFLDKVMTFDKNVSLCRDSKNRIEIYFGPYYSNNERTNVLNNLIENGFKESYLVDFTQEEYEKRCKY